MCTFEVGAILADMTIYTFNDEEARIEFVKLKKVQMRECWRPIAEKKLSNQLNGAFLIKLLYEFYTFCVDYTEIIDCRKELVAPRPGRTFSSLCIIVGKDNTRKL